MKWASLVVFISFRIGEGGPTADSLSSDWSLPETGVSLSCPQLLIGARAEVGVRLPSNNTRALLADFLTPPPCSPSTGSERSPPSKPTNSPRTLRSEYPTPVMVTITAPPPPFLARLSAGPEDARRLPPSLFQRLMRGDNNCEHQAGCCLAGPGSSARPALKRVRRRKGKIRPSPSGLLPSRYQQYQHHRAGLGRRAPLGAPCPGELRSLPAPVAVPVTPAEEPPTSAPPRPAPGKPLRKEFLKNKMGKSEKAPGAHCQPVHSTHLGEQPKSSKQKSRGNMPLTKSTSVKKTENNFWQLSVSPEIIDKQEKKPLNNTENFRNMKSKKPGSPTEVNQKESYAGAKFSDPPSPSVLPKPPSHWVGCTVEYSDQNKELMAVHLKTLLKVQA
ncbi:proline-rich nuclear receptor coactivator 1 [Carettochelys insculpta]|uniref:proline-rich nuclear receptor coactivator 1 n=1 Tax=Carettochelys insculpta TaxID=44489 RepID=UPI003EB7E7A7